MYVMAVTYGAQLIATGPKVHDMVDVLCLPQHVVTLTPLNVQRISSRLDKKRQESTASKSRKILNLINMTSKARNVRWEWLAHHC